MSEFENFSVELTREPFEGEFSAPYGGRILYGPHGKILGTVSGKRICDLNGHELAVYCGKENSEDGNGKKIKSRIYSGKDGVRFSLIADRLYSVTEAGEDFVGTIEVTGRNPAHIILLSALALLLAATIAFIALINLPVYEHPVIEVKDDNGNWSAQGKIAVLDDTVKPGSSGEYGFVISNPYEVELMYSFAIVGVYEGTEEEIYFPLQFRLKMNNALIETDRWLKADELKYSELEMRAKSEQSFTLQWRWSFEDGNDGNDTLIGADGGKLSLILKLTAQRGGNAF